jgi:hypothetical protein
MFFLYGESLIYYFKHIVFVDEYFLYFAIHHRFISSVLYLIGTPSPTAILTCRLCFLRHDVDPRGIRISIHAILLDSYDSPPRRFPSTLHHQLHLRGPHLVLPSCLPRYHERYIRIRLWDALGTHTAHSPFAKEDRRGIYWWMDLHYYHWRWDCVYLDAVQVHDLSCHCSHTATLLRLTD